MALQTPSTGDSNPTNETTPLLNEPHTGNGSISDDAPTQPKSSHLTFLLMIMAAVLVLEASDNLIDSPMTRLMESISCFRYYERADPSKLLTTADHAGPGAIYGTSEHWCKVDAVQSEVAMIRSWQFFFEGIPALILAMPFAWLQDKFGRRPFIIIGAISMLLRGTWIMLVLWFWQSFTLQWTWASALYALAMGGSPVISALFFTMMTDITAEAQRATAFMRLGAMVLLMGFIVPPLTALLMTYNPWLPVFLGALLSLVGLTLMCMIPETLGYHQLDASTAEPVLASSPDTSVALQTVSAAFLQRLFADFTMAVSFLWADLRIPALISPFLLNILSDASVQLLVQYASKRYDLDISRATLLLTIRAGVTFLLLFTIIPALSDLLMTRLGISVKRKDLFVTRVSLAIMGLGWALIGLSPTSWLFVSSLVVATLGSGAMYSLRSILIALVPPQQVALTYSITSIIDTLGLMFGAPILAQCFDTGMAIGGAGIGLPFYVLGGVCSLFFFVLLAIRLRKGEDDCAADADEA